mgnify:CR=1 FL=1
MWENTKEQQDDPLTDLRLSMLEAEPLIDVPDSAAESLRQMLAQLGRNGMLPERLSVVAALREEGVTFISQALAALIAHDYGTKVCLVDLNWWWPSDHLRMADARGGLAAVLNGKLPLDEALVYSGWPQLSILPAGRLEQYERPVVARSQGLRDVLDDLASQFDHLILDIPALLATSDAVPLASNGTMTCLVVRQGVTGIEDVRPALDKIQHLPLAGVILNRVRISTPGPLVRLFADR